MIYYLFRKGKVRKIKAENILINKNTPRGDPADFYERKPYNGRRLLGYSEILGTEKDGVFEIRNCNMTQERLEVIQGLGIPISEKLFHNGDCYTTIEKPLKKIKYRASFRKE